jgi:hypothetical protein
MFADGRLKELEPEEELSVEEAFVPSDVESSVKEAVITGAPSQFVSDRNRDRPQTPTQTPILPSTASPTASPQDKKTIQSESGTQSPSTSTPLS